MEAEISSIIDKLEVYKRDGKYAVYKPLLLLIILNEISKGGENDFPFTRLYPQLTALMEKHGWNTITRKKAEYPFHFLAFSILWETNIDKTALKHPSSPSKTEFKDAIGQINHKAYKYLSERKEVILRLVNQIETKFFNSQKVEV